MTDFERNVAHIRKLAIFFIVLTVGYLIFNLFKHNRVGDHYLSIVYIVILVFGWKFMQTKLAALIETDGSQRNHIASYGSMIFFLLRSFKDLPKAKAMLLVPLLVDEFLKCPSLLPHTHQLFSKETKGFLIEWCQDEIQYLSTIENDADECEQITAKIIGMEEFIAALKYPPDLTKTH